MSEINRLSLEQYLIEKDFRIIGNFNDARIPKSITENIVLDQIEAIFEFQKAAMEYEGTTYKVINNKIGKTVEKYKIWIKNLSKTLRTIKSKDYINEFEKTLIETSDVYLERAEECINVVNDSDYLGLVKRSMKRSELCLGITYLNNIRKKDSIEIASLNRCAYNLIEMDVIYLIRKLKRNDIVMDYNKIINYFCELQGLDKNSYMFMLALSSYPHEYMKCSERYRLKKNKFNVDYYKCKLKDAMKRDGESLLLGANIC